MSACDITGSSPTAFDHKKILRYFYFTLKTCLIKTCLNVSQGNDCTLNVSQGNTALLMFLSVITVSYHTPLILW